MRTLCLLALVLGTAAAASAVVVDGRVTASAYGYEAGVTDSTTSTYLRSHAALRLQARRLGHPDLSLSTFLRGTTDLADQAASDPRLRVYSLTLRYRGHGVDARLGRQHVMASVGYGTIDGAHLSGAHAGVALQIYGGALTPVDDEGLGSFDEGYLWGARLSTRRVRDIDLAVSYADRQREPVAYADSGRFSGFTGTPQAVRRQLVGLEASRSFGRHALRARLDYDVEDGGVRRGQVSARCGLSADLDLTAQWRHREPDLFAGSLLGVFASQGYDELTLGASYRVSPGWSVGLRAATVLYDDDDSQRLGLWTSLGRYLTVSYDRSQGYAGANDGLNGNLFCPLGRRLTLRAQLGLSAYERFADDDRQGLVTAVAGATWRPARTLSVDAQVQGLHNPAYDSDVRLLARGSWRFRQ